MVIEIAYITIDPAHAEQFEAAVANAVPLFRAAKGCHGMRLESVEEDAAQYRLCVDWETVEDHMVTFREAEAFQQWRALVGPYFKDSPRVEHWRKTADFF